jgi:solute:Na+ symporter, SSS family
MIVQTLPAVFLGLLVRRLNKYALIVGLLAGEVFGIYLMEVRNNFGAWTSSLYSTPGVGFLFIGLLALSLNLGIVVVWNLVSPPKDGAMLEPVSN